ncbi:iron complex transport system substrate-binding protein [Deinobacterium chartae]|uniref:Iron complex transport system substrate-binding protein n=1 Tax=Deinobacterium chartae TaxID=521158 RepID=A0A841I2H7_9DEIO|nr:ABC transporter substrate-binding protein [Deinobacterium chartae]MBB6100021.1 iron complex transport system substrate-binding protein [Deinobacterium chartae]
MKKLLLTAMLALLPAAAAVRVNNCGLALNVQAPPKRAVTLNQSATEIMLSLGLEGRMVGTAYLDDRIWPRLEAAYRKVPVLAAEYPSQEVLLNAAPDFIYGAYASAFGKDVAGARTELLKSGVIAFLSPLSCENRALRPARLTMQHIYDEILAVGRIFGVTERARSVVAGMRRDELQVKALAAHARSSPRVMWLDNLEKQPSVGGSGGVPGMILRMVGARNVFEDLPGSWGEVSWEAVLSRPIDAIVVADASWSPAAEKIAALTGNPVYADIRAVRERRFIVVPFSETTPGVRVLAAAQRVARGLYPGSAR